MGWIKDTFFGGAEKKAAKAQTESLERAQKYLEESSEEAKGEINKLFPEAERSLKTGFAEALDVLSSGVDPRLRTFTEGNMNAQSMVAAGMPQIQNALLGRPVNFSALQPRGSMPDTSYLTERTLAPFETPAAPEAVPQYPGFENFLSGGFAFSPGAWQSAMSRTRKIN